MHSHPSIHEQQQPPQSQSQAMLQHSPVVQQQQQQQRQTSSSPAPQQASAASPGPLDNPQQALVAAVAAAALHKMQSQELEHARSTRQVQSGTHMSPVVEELLEDVEMPQAPDASTSRPHSLTL